MKRALYERIQPYLPKEGVRELPVGFRVNTPELCATTSPETRQATKAHDYSVNWILEQGQPEIVNGSTGKTINDATSRISKKSRETEKANVILVHFNPFLLSVQSFLGCERAPDAQQAFRPPCKIFRGQDAGH